MSNHRLENNREFFQAPLNSIIEVVQEVVLSVNAGLISNLADTKQKWKQKRYKLLSLSSSELKSLLRNRRGFLLLRECDELCKIDILDVDELQRRRIRNEHFAPLPEDFTERVRSLVSHEERRDKQKQLTQAHRGGKPALLFMLSQLSQC